MLVYFFVNNVFNNMDKFKTNSSLHDFKTRSKSQLHFLPTKLTSVKKGVTYPAIKVFNNLPSNILELQENQTLLKSALRKYLLNYVFYSVEKFLVQNDKN